MNIILEFEKPIVELEGKLKELKHLVDSGDNKAKLESTKLEKKIEITLKEIYKKLTPWEKVQVARHPARPHFLDYVNGFIEDYIPLSGDRFFGEDRALIGGIGLFRGYSVILIGNEKGHDTKTRLERNFGMAHPEGYRKATRLMTLANKFNLPVLTFVDTAGAYPGIEAEERGQAEAIARCIESCINLETPLISSIVGEGGSGGAMALAAGNKVIMLEHSIYSVISPEGCASILWRNPEKSKDAAEALKLTSDDMLALKVVDKVVKEPIGGAHRSPNEIINELAGVIEEQLIELNFSENKQYTDDRKEKFLAIGRITGR
ncbi:MAG: Acetyl-coenzyme A carboxylase carboxyl transferase subunit alpha [Alphaproteobacteria bacterium MarineAlpha2_Bin1]|nr:MAG: Acetyl-coenzyme A carboxylase carboxyl transferase subunit alpha [Alphaproteobacteria bacterium MarineAlpha2_Bin1]|tara:strand:- start:103 stop:1059 length:957 start_codon:yes stop_codon:yes gene_type:complete